MKRFWDDTTAEAAGEGYEIRLDGKALHLPGGAVLRVRSAQLAEAIADEWQRAGGQKGGEMSFADTPLTQLAGTAQERIVPDPWPAIDAIARYGETDLLCYRAAFPPELVARQQAGWQPWLDWVAAAYNAPLRVTTGIQHIKQHTASVSALRDAVASHDPYSLAALGIAVPALGSLVLGLALVDGRIDPESAFSLGALDELFQAELWGEDDEAAARRRVVARDIALASRFVRLARGTA